MLKGQAFRIYRIFKKHCYMPLPETALAFIVIKKSKIELRR